MKNILIYVLRNCNVALRLAGVSFLRRNIVMESCYFIFPLQLLEHCVIWLEDPRCCWPVAGRQHRGCIIPQAVTHNLVLLKMVKIIARNMLS